jgi:thiol-disulfide isomerase/thioredoxin
MSSNAQTPAEPSGERVAKRRRLVLAGAGALAAVGGAGLAWWRLQPHAAAPGALAEVGGLWSRTFETPEGGRLVMESFRGKPLLINFWATWCPPCVEELPLLDRFYRENSGKGFQVVGIAIDQVPAGPCGQVAHGGHVLPCSSPGAKPFVEVGSQVKEGETICIIEAMKILNEIEADKSGTSRRSWAKTARRSNTASRCSSSNKGGSCSRKSWSPTAAKLPCASSAPAASWASRPSWSIPRPTARPSTSSWPKRPCASGPRPSPLSYLNMPAIISAAEVTDAEAIHPGYGFLSENADFAERVEKSGFQFIGPTPESIRIMGDKVSAKQAMIKAGVPCVPGSEGELPDDPVQIRRIAKRSATRSSSRRLAAAAAAACAWCTPRPPWSMRCR